MPPPPLQREEPGARQGPQLPTATWPANRGAERETQMWLTTQRGPGGAERPQAAHPGSSPARPPLTWMCMYRNRRHRHRRQGPPGGTSDEEPANAMQEMQETRTQSLRQEDPLPTPCRRCKRHRLSPCVRKIPCRRKWQPTPVFLAGESHGRRNLAECGAQGCKESDTTEAPSLTHVIGVKQPHFFLISIYFLRVGAQRQHVGSVLQYAALVA